MNLEWYNILNHPTFTPPSWVFLPAWSILYICMGISLFIYLKTPNKKYPQVALNCFWMQLVLNILWSPIFFELHQIKLGFIIVCMILLFTFLTIIFFYKTSKLSAYLLVPYFIWVLFAGYLNFGFMMLN